MTPQDAVVEHLALSELDLADDVVTALQESESYRYLTTTALGQLHQAYRTIRSLREQNAALRDEIRRYTAAETRGQAA